MYVPPSIDEMLEQMRDTMLRWHTEGRRGEIAIVRGDHQWQLEERPVYKHKAVRHEEGSGKAIARVGER